MYFLLAVTFIIPEICFQDYFTLLCSVILSPSILVQKWLLHYPVHHSPLNHTQVLLHQAHTQESAMGPSHSVAPVGLRENLLPAFAIQSECLSTSFILGSPQTMICLPLWAICGNWAVQLNTWWEKSILSLPRHQRKPVGMGSDVVNAKLQVDEHVEGNASSPVLLGCAEEKEDGCCSSV